jgi:hypothetical protein
VILIITEFLLLDSRPTRIAKTAEKILRAVSVCLLDEDVVIICDRVSSLYVSIGLVLNPPFYENLEGNATAKTTLSY